MFLTELFIFSSNCKSVPFLQQPVCLCRNSSCFFVMFVPFICSCRPNCYTYLTGALVLFIADNMRNQTQDTKYIRHQKKIRYFGTRDKHCFSLYWICLMYSMCQLLRNLPTVAYKFDKVKTSVENHIKLDEWLQSLQENETMSRLNDILKPPVFLTSSRTILLPARMLADPGFRLRSSLKSVVLLTIIICGNIELNPGPNSGQTDHCGTCGIIVRQRDRAIFCEDCNKWKHAKCENITVREYRNLQNNLDPWYCSACSSPCGVCDQNVRELDTAILCDSCERWFHTACTGVSESAIINCYKPRGIYGTA